MNKYQREFLQYFTENMITYTKQKKASLSPLKKKLSDAIGGIIFKQLVSKESIKKQFLSIGLTKVIEGQEKSKIDRKILKALVNEEDPCFKEIIHLLKKLKSNQQQDDGKLFLKMVDKGEHSFHNTPHIPSIINNSFKKGKQIEFSPL